MSTGALAVPKKVRRHRSGETCERDAGDCSINRLVYEQPDPRKVAALIDQGYGLGACLSRWPHVGYGTMVKLARVGRIQSGIAAQAKVPGAREARLPSARRPPSPPPTPCRARSPLRRRPGSPGRTCSACSTLGGSPTGRGYQ